MLTELYGKGGHVCQPARDGEIRCPLIVRPTSEDVITGHLCLVLRSLNPRWWLPDLLNTALGAPRFRRQVFRRLRIEPWQNRKKFPRELLPWREGSTQVDLTITWENPPTTVFIETKLGADLARKVAGDTGDSGYPSDQLIRNIRVGLWECGWYRRRPLFDLPPSDFVMILLRPQRGHELVKRYRDPEQVRTAIPRGSQLAGLPYTPFLGEASFADVAAILDRNQCWFSRSERVLSRTMVQFFNGRTATIRRHSEVQHTRATNVRLSNRDSHLAPLVPT